MSKFILAFSADPGGAQCLVPVIRELEKVFPVVTLSKGEGLDSFRAAGCPAVALRSDDGLYLDRLVEEVSCDGPAVSPPVLVLTSASSLPDVDMTEQRLWRWADERGIASLAVLDQWQNIMRRFSSPHVSDRPPARPTRIAVMDELVRKEMLAGGFTADQVVVTGQPYLEWSLQHSRAKQLDCRPQVRRKMIVESNERVICFVSEPLARFYGREMLGFDEFSILTEVVASLRASCKTVQPVCLWIKLHPKDRYEDFGRWQGGQVCPGFRLRVIQKEIGPEETLWGSDLVIGMCSLLLVQAALIGRPVISAQLNASNSQPDWCYLSQRGWIPRITSTRELQHLLQRLLNDQQYLREYVARQSVMSSHEGAAKRIAELSVRLIQTGQAIHAPVTHLGHAKQGMND